MVQSSNLQLLNGRNKPSASTLSGTLYHFTVLAGSDAVPIAFEDFLGNPSDDGRSLLVTFELLEQLCFKLLNIGH